MAHVDVYLRVLCALYEEVVSFHVCRFMEDVQHNSVMKVWVSVKDGVLIITNDLPKYHVFHVFLVFFIASVTHGCFYF